mgnify:CR=1 FL=1
MVVSKRTVGRRIPWLTVLSVKITSIFLTSAMCLKLSFLLRSTTYLAVALVVAGCGTLGSQNSATVYDRQGIDVVIEPTTGNSFVLTDEKIRDQFCMTPPPDVIDSKNSSGSLSVKGVSLSEGTGLSLTGLGGRSPAVLISREIMYRTCELYVNGRVTKEESFSLFKSSLDRVVEIAKAQIAQGTSAQISESSNSLASQSGGGGGDGSSQSGGGGGNGSPLSGGGGGDGSSQSGGGGGNGSPLSGGGG